MATGHRNSPGSEDVLNLVERLKLPFSNYALVTRALTHRSYVNEHPEALEDNERLEFLGDAVLDFMVGEWLYQHFPEMAEGGLTRLRSALVRTEQLAEFAQQIDLGAGIYLGRGEEETGGRERPALLCGVFEALVGALYLDAGLQAVRTFIEPLLLTKMGTVLLNRRETDPKSLLQEWVQSQGFGPPVYRTVDSSGLDHEKIFEVEVIVNGQGFGRGKGSSKQSAAKNAARDALELIGIIE
jgi:ribonuclease-3